MLFVLIEHLESVFEQDESKARRTPILPQYRKTGNSNHAAVTPSSQLHHMGLLNRSAPRIGELKQVCSGSQPTQVELDAALSSLDR